MIISLLFFVGFIFWMKFSMSEETLKERLDKLESEVLALGKPPLKAKRTKRTKK